MEYIVKKGDSLSKIAKQNNLTLDKLLSLNKNIKNPDYIQIGQKINLPSQSSINTHYYDNNDGYPINPPKKVITAPKKPTENVSNPAPKTPVKKQEVKTEEPSFFNSLSVQKFTPEQLEQLKNYFKNTNIITDFWQSLPNIINKKSKNNRLLKYGGKINDNKGYLLENLNNFTPKKIIKGSQYGTNITTENMAFPILANNKVLYPNTGEYYFPQSEVEEYPLKAEGGANAPLYSGDWGNAIYMYKNGGMVAPNNIDMSNNKGYSGAALMYPIKYGGKIYENELQQFQKGGIIKYNKFKNSLPDNLKNTPEDDYAMRYYWKHNNKPKSFDESINREQPMFTMEDDGYYHAPSVEPNTLRFLKPKDHPTLQYELDWYNSDDPDAVDFRSKYDLDDSKKFYKYIPKLQKGGKIDSTVVKNFGIKSKKYLNHDASNFKIGLENMKADFALNPVGMGLDVGSAAMDSIATGLSTLGKDGSKAQAFGEGASNAMNIAGNFTKPFESIPVVGKALSAAGKTLGFIIGGSLNARRQAIENKEMEYYNDVRNFNERNSVAVNQPSHFGQYMAEYGMNMEDKLINEIYNDFENLIKNK